MKDFISELDKENFISLKGIVNNNYGNFKSIKQANFFKENRSFPLREAKGSDWFAKMAENISLDEEDFLVVSRVEIDFGIHKRGGKGLRPITYVFICDIYGVKSFIKITHTHETDDTGKVWRYPANKCTIEWERLDDWEKPSYLEEDTPESSFVGQSGERIERKVKFEGEHTFEKKDYFGNPQTNFIYKFRDNEGNLYVWFTTCVKFLKKGESLDIRMTIKEHNNFRDEKQTIVSRVYIKDYDEDERLQRSREEVV